MKKNGLVVANFIKALEKIDDTDNNIYHINTTSVSKLKMVSNIIESVLNEYEIKGFITESNHSKLYKMFDSVMIVKENDARTNPND